MKFGDQVLFTENSKEYSATVLSERILDSHAGSNSEPLLSIGYFAEVPGFAGTARQGELVQFRADVAHESVTAIDGVIYPGGRWREISAPEAPLSVPPIVFVTEEGVTTSEVPPLEPGQVYSSTSSTGEVTEIPRVEAEPGGVIPIVIGASVVTTEENASLANSWTDEAKANRKWGANGVVVAEHNSHGLCYDIRHEDGTVGSYDPSEFIVQGEKPLTIN